MRYFNRITVVCFLCVGVFQTSAFAMEGAGVHSMLLVDNLEYSGQRDGDINWDLMAWFGGDWNRIWIKAEGEVPTDQSGFGAEAQLLYSRLISPFWEAQVGVRMDYLLKDDQSDQRVFGVLSMEGLAPYWFEVEPSIYVSQDGDLSARFKASLDLRVTQRLIAQPSFEMNAALRSAPAFGVGEGINDLQPEFRLRYEITREFAPYLGVGWNRKIGETADFVESAGGNVSSWNAIVGLRFWL